MKDKRFDIEYYLDHEIFNTLRKSFDISRYYNYNYPIELFFDKNLNMYLSEGRKLIADFFIETELFLSKLPLHEIRYFLLKSQNINFDKYRGEMSFGSDKEIIVSKVLTRSQKFLAVWNDLFELKEKHELNSEYCKADICYLRLDKLVHYYLFHLRKHAEENNVFKAQNILIDYAKAEFDCLINTLKVITENNSYLILKEKTNAYTGFNNEHEANHFSERMPLSVPREHFKVLTTTNSKNGNPFLTDEQFEKFIQRAFCGNNKMPKQKINLVTREKQFVVRRFFEFYQYSVSESYEFQQSRGKFIKLLTDNFTGWEFEDIKNNFNKTVKRKW